MLKTAFAAARDRQRLQEIVGVLLGYGFSNVVDRLGLGAFARLARRRKPNADIARLAQPERVRRAIEALGPTFIKLGQILASRADLLAPQWTNELGKLHSQVSPVPWEVMQPQLEADLGGSPFDVFAEFDTTPIASASVAQVYRARLEDGQDVIVKVLRPGLRKVIEADLRILGHTTSMVESRWPELSRYKPQEQLRHLASGMNGELDLAGEAANCELLAQVFADRDDVIIPKIYWQWTSERVLVQEFIHGIPPTNLARLREAGLDPVVLAQKVTDVFLYMALVEGVFHADPHPGNVLAMSGNKIGFIDFGIIGRLSEKRRTQLLTLIAATLKKDPDGLVSVLLAWSGASSPDLGRLESSAQAFVIKHSKKPLNLGLVVTDFMTMARENDLAMPTDLAILFKALVTADGVMRQLDPDFDLFAAAGPTVERTMRRRFSIRGMRRNVEAVSTGLLGAAVELPSLIHLLLVRLKQGRVSVEIELKGVEKLTNTIERAAARIAVALVVAAFAVGVAPRLIELGDVSFGIITTIVALLGIGWLVLLRRRPW